MSPLAIRRARAALVAIAVAWVVAQIVLVGVHRWFAWDEAVYFAKASPKLPTITWDPVRALGFPAILWPVIAPGGSVVAVRVELLLLGATGLVLAYGTWSTRLGWAAPAAALLFAGSWPALFYGTELYPNLLVALGLLGAVGAAAPREGRPGGSPGWVLAFTTVAACIRPTDALLAGVAVVPVWLLVQRRDAVASSVALVAGTAIGWLLWVAEAFVSFHGPISRFRAAFERQPARDPRSGLITALVHRAPGTVLMTKGVVAALGWVAFLTALLAAGVWLAARRGQLAVVAPPAVAGLLLVVTYAVYWSDTGVRFMLPGFALATIPAGVALEAASCAARRPRRWWGAVAAVVVVIAAGSVVAHAREAHAVARAERKTRAIPHEAGLELARLAGGRPCAFVAQFDFPQLEIASHCDGVPLRFDQTTVVPRSFTRRPEDLFAVGFKPPIAGSPIARWPVVSPSGAPGVSIYVAPSRAAHR